MAPSTTLEILRLRAKNLENWCGQQRTALWVGSLVLSIITLLATAEEPKSSYTTPLPTGVRLDPAGEFIDQPIRNSEYFAGLRVSRSFSEQYRLGLECLQDRFYLSNSTLFLENRCAVDLVRRWGDLAEYQSFSPSQSRVSKLCWNIRSTIEDSN